MGRVMRVVQLSVSIVDRRAANAKQMQSDPSIRHHDVSKNNYREPTDCVEPKSCIKLAKTWQQKTEPARNPSARSLRIAIVVL